MAGAPLTAKEVDRYDDQFGWNRDNLVPFMGRGFFVFKKKGVI